MTTEERARIVAEAEEQMARLEPAHRTWEQLMTDRNHDERMTPTTPETTHPAVADDKIAKCGTVDDHAENYRELLATAETRVDEMTMLLSAIETLPKSPIRKRLAEVVVGHYL